jgi:ubiquinol-cytochrome c reductase cytochrome b subunit
MNRVTAWLDRRLNLHGVRSAVLDGDVPDGLTWWNTLGAATLAAFMVQFITGAVLATYYVPAPDHAYDSIEFVRQQVAGGALLRGMHHWGASVTVVLVIAHIVRVFVMGAYKYPREANWLVGVGLLVIVLAFAFTGYLLPWDQRAYWATVVGTSIGRSTPLIGSQVEALLRSGTDVGAATLTRFYAFHVLWFPAALAILILFHLALLIHQGIAPPPKTLESAAPLRTSDADYPTYYEQTYAATKTIKQFWPDMLARYAIVSFITAAIIFVLGATAGASLEAPADPTDGSYVPTPEWYFLPLYQLMGLVPPWMESIVAVGVPGALILLLLALPFFDRRSTRSLGRRPLALASLVVILGGSGLLLGAALQNAASTPEPQAGPVLTAAQHAGRAVFWAQQCNLCHKIGNEGVDVGPNLTDVGLRHSAMWLHSFLEEPSRFSENSMMPAFGPPRLTHAELEELAQYLSSLRGGAGPDVEPQFKDSFP